MDLNRIYEELGRADAAACESRAEWDCAEEVMREERGVMTKRHEVARAEQRHKHERNMIRLQGLREVVKQVQQGIDPLVAKLTCDSAVAQAYDMLDAQLAPNESEEEDCIVECDEEDTIRLNP